MLSVGIDLGGTFTDGYFADDARWLTRKVPTLAFDLTRSVVQCLRGGAEAFGEPLGRFLDRVDVLRLATTVGTNAVIEGTGSRVGLLVGSGQERLLYGDRPPRQLFANFLDLELVRAVPPSPDREEVLALCRDLVGLGVRQVVVSLPRTQGAAAEREIRKIVRDRYPEHYLRSVPLQLASEVSACASDEVRTATAVVNAYLHRDMAKLLYQTEEALQADGLRAPILVVHANSGVARVAKTTAISTYSSGPSAGLSAAEWIATRYRDPLVVTADMGGTTLDLGLVADGQCETETRPLVAGVRVALPMNRTSSIGCAGGSLVRVEDGSVVIGPQSAGAVPGPAAFGYGGKHPTLTDADVVVGVLEPGRELGGRFVLDAELANAALVTHVGAALGCSAARAATEVRRAAARQLGEALAGFLASRAVDPAAVVVYAFGGAGPVHLGAAARRAGIRRMRSFPFGSAFSAFGCTVVDLRHRYELGWDGAPFVPEELRERLEPLLRRGLADVRAEGYDPGRARASLLLLGWDGVERSRLGPSTAETAGTILDTLVVAVSSAGGAWHGTESVALELEVPVPRVRPAPRPAPLAPGRPVARRAVSWEGEELATDVYRWSDLRPGDRLAGPVLLEDRDTTHAVGPGWSVALDGDGNALWEAIG